MDKHVIAPRFQGSENSTWDNFEELAEKYDAVNLGMGSSDSAPPKILSEALAKVATHGSPYLHQYTRSMGHPRLVNILSRMYGGLTNWKIDPMTEILVSEGAQGALFASIQAHIHPEDEVIMFEPCFSNYIPLVKSSGGIIKSLPLQYKPKDPKNPTSNDFFFDEEDLAALFSDKTKIFLLNTPNSPLGKIFTRNELEFIAKLCIKWNVLCISDEVYEWLLQSSAQHIRMATLPGMRNRTLTIGSAGKSAGISGWRIGWVYGPAPFIKNAWSVQRQMVFTVNTPMQEAIATVLELELNRLHTPDCLFRVMAEEIERKKILLADGLKEIGLCPIVPDGGCYMMVDWSSVANEIDVSQEVGLIDEKFARWMVKNAQVQGLPGGMFYSEKNKMLGEKLLRFSLMKNEESIKKAVELLRKCNSLK